MVPVSDEPKAEDFDSRMKKRLHEAFKKKLLDAGISKTVVDKLYDDWMFDIEKETIGILTSVAMSNEQTIYELRCLNNLWQSDDSITSVKYTDFMAEVTFLSGMKIKLPMKNQYPRDQGLFISRLRKQYTDEVIKKL